MSSLPSPRAIGKPEEWEAYERAKMAEQDARGALAVAHQEGETVGKAGALLTSLQPAALP